jgi:hypothetical protein
MDGSTLKPEAPCGAEGGSERLDLLVSLESELEAWLYKLSPPGTPFSIPGLLSN